MDSLRDKESVGEERLTGYIVKGVTYPMVELDSWRSEEMGEELEKSLELDWERMGEPMGEDNGEMGTAREKSSIIGGEAWIIWKGFGGEGLDFFFFGFPDVSNKNSWGLLHS